MDFQENLPANTSEKPIQNSVELDNLEALYLRCQTKADQGEDGIKKTATEGFVSAMRTALNWEAKRTSTENPQRQAIKQLMEAFLSDDYKFLINYQGIYDMSVRSWLESTLSEGEILNLELDELYQQCCAKVAAESNPKLKGWLEKFMQRVETIVTIDIEVEKRVGSVSEVARRELMTILQAILDYKFEWLEQYKVQHNDLRYNEVFHIYASRARKFLREKLGQEAPKNSNEQPDSKLPIDEIDEDGVEKLLTLCQLESMGDPLKEGFLKGMSVSAETNEIDSKTFVKILDVFRRDDFQGLAAIYRGLPRSLPRTTMVVYMTKTGHLSLIAP